MLKYRKILLISPPPVKAFQNTFFYPGYKPPGYKPPQNPFTKLYKPKAYKQDFRVCWFQS